MKVIPIWLGEELISGQVIKFRSYIQRGILGSCFLRFFLLDFQVFIFLDLIKSLPDWAYWAGFSFLWCLYGFRVGFRLKYL